MFSISSTDSSIDMLVTTYHMWCILLFACIVMYWFIDSYVISISFLKWYRSFQFYLYISANVCKLWTQLHPLCFFFIYIVGLHYHLSKFLRRCYHNVHVGGINYFCLCSVYLTNFNLKKKPTKLSCQIFIHFCQLPS